jgi:hypothetical protein
MESSGKNVDDTVAVLDRRCQPASGGAGCDVKDISMQSAALSNNEQLLWWLQQLEDTLGMLIEMMESA